ncbi:MAG: hypothetical protein EA390_03465 [Balneolaceae bacterium]|nr:MAG: hypothetical protein EA390_03465 [Balneolaceae bacterium]
MTSSAAFSLQASQMSTDGETLKTALTITEDNFSCFRSLECLKRNNPFPKSDLSKIRLNDFRSEGYTIEGSSKNESLHAEYNYRGDLVKATVIQRNIPLPKAINDILASGELESWTMIGNELVIRNFDRSTMQYKVILLRDDDIRVEYFNKHGEFQNRML